MDTLALGPGLYSSPNTSSSLNITAANLAAAIVRALGTETQPATASGEIVPEAALARLGSILNLLLNPLLNPKHGAAPMDINLDQLVSNSALQNALKQLPPELLSRPQVLQALVLQNTLLSTAPASIPGQPNAPLPDKAAALPQLILPQPTTPNNAGSAAATTIAPALYRLTLQWQNRLLQVVSAQPFPAGTKLQIQSTPNGELTLLAQAPAAAAAVNRAQTVLNAPPPAATSQPIAAPQPLETLQQSARELLPRQQALHTLVPLLQKFLQPTAQSQLPQPVVKALAQLLQSMPHAEQMQDTGALRRAVENSGSFFENRLTPAPSDRTPTPPAAVIAGDLKAQINVLLAVIRNVAPHALQASNALHAARAQIPVDSDELVYSHKPAAHASSPIAMNETATDATDSLLADLGKLLQSGLARIQLHQLDSATARQVGSETQPPLPTWMIEVPLRTPYGADQLQLRIEQRRQQSASRSKQQWTVHIGLDLHAAGKLAAVLTIAEKNVSATLWAEQEQTHLAVRNELDYLRAGLESVGVKVTEMQCRHGVPPARGSALTQRLVDVHT